MRSLKCFVPVLVLLYLGSSSARPGEFLSYLELEYLRISVEGGEEAMQKLTVLRYERVFYETNRRTLIIFDAIIFAL